MTSASQPSRGRAAIAALIVVLVVFAASFGVRKATASSTQAAPLPATLVISTDAGARLRRSRCPRRCRRCAVRRVRAPRSDSDSSPSPTPAADHADPSPIHRTPSNRAAEQWQRQRPGARRLVSKSA